MSIPRSILIRLTSDWLSQERSRNRRIHRELSVDDGEDDVESWIENNGIARIGRCGSSAALWDFDGGHLFCPRISRLKCRRAAEDGRQFTTLEFVQAIVLILCIRPSSCGSTSLSSLILYLTTTLRPHKYIFIPAFRHRLSQASIFKGRRPSET